MSFLNRILSGWRNPHYVRGMRYYNRCEFTKALEEFEILLKGGRDRRNLDMELARFYAAEAHTKLGLDFYRQRDFQRARTEFQAALEVEGNFPDLYYYLGSLARRDGSYSEAQSLLDRTLELNPIHRPALACRALVHRAGKNEGLAREDLMLLVSTGFPMPEIRAYQSPLSLRASMTAARDRMSDRSLLRALDAYDRGHYGETLSTLGAAIDAHPGYADLRYRQGQLLVEMTRLHEAVASFDAALGINPSFLDAHLSRGICLLALNRPDQAEQSLARAAALQPEYADVAFYQGVALSRMGNLREALEPLARALEVNPMFWRAHFVAGQIHASLGELDQGYASLALALDHQSPEPRDWETSGRGVGQKAGAVARLEEAVTMHPRYADLHYELGLAYLGQGDPSRARKAFHRALEINPGYAAPHAGLGMMEVLRGKPAAAVPHLTSVLNCAPDRADVQCLLGESWLAMGNPVESTRAYQSALHLNPEYLSAMLGLAKVHRSQRRDQEADDLYRKVLEMDPDHAVPREGRRPRVHSELEQVGL